MNSKLSKNLIGHIKNCQICHSSKLEIVLNLGHQAPVHAHLTPDKVNHPETLYPLNLCRCAACGLLQINYAVEPKIIFPQEYPYYTGMTGMLIKNFRDLVSSVYNMYNLTPKDLVIDIGSNDGTLLRGFREMGLKVLGIEPTQVAKIAVKNKIPTVHDFFSSHAAKNIAKKYGKAKIVTATNMFAHINNLSDFIQGVKTILTKDGVFISESQYLRDVIEKLEFDTIYHEHLRYYSLKPLIKLFNSAGMSVVDAERIPAAGGSIRVYAMLGRRKPSKRVRELLEEEKKFGLYDKKTFVKFAQKAVKIRATLQTLLAKFSKRGEVVGIGAPGRSNTFLQYVGIDKNILKYACEKTGSPKIGLLTPGTHIPIVDEKILLKEQPKFGLLLSWHIGEELIAKLRKQGFKGKFIMPMPNPKII